MEQEELPADATTLIYLAKADGFDLAARCLRGFVVPPAVWGEAVEAGERRGYPDAARIRVAEAAGFLRRIALPDAVEALSATIAAAHRLGLGESEVLALAHEPRRAIVDDGRAARVAESLGIQPLSTLFLPALGRQAGSLGEDEALAYVRSIAIAANARAEAVFVVERFIRGVR